MVRMVSPVRSAKSPDIWGFFVFSKPVLIPMLPISGHQLTQLIPQKEPFVFISSLDSINDNKCVTSFIVNSSNALCYNQKLTTAGLLENMAQSAGCKMGYEDFAKQKVSRRGFIGEIKDFYFSRLPRVGEKLTTEIIIEGKVFGAVTLVAAKVFCENEEIAGCKMKVFFEQSE